MVSFRVWRNIVYWEYVTENYEDGTPIPADWRMELSAFWRWLKYRWCLFARHKWVDTGAPNAGALRDDVQDGLVYCERCGKIKREGQ